MRKCMRPREPLADCPHSRKVRERPLRAQEKRAAGQDRELRLRGKPLKDRGRQHETKSLQEHLIKSNKESEAVVGLVNR